MATKAEPKVIDNLRYYNQLQAPPKDALKDIKGGRLKGFTDINPQWRYEALTQQFGPCGIGWKYEPTGEKTVPCPDGQLLLFVGVNLYYKEEGEWSAPVPGHGGDFIIKMEKGSLYYNDEAYKMAYTDAIGTASKLIGVAANIYRGRQDTKYGRQGLETTSTPPRSSNQSPADASFNAPPPPEPPAQAKPEPEPPKKGFNVFGKAYVEHDPKTKEIMLLTREGGYKKLADIEDVLLAKCLLMSNYEAAWLEIQQYLANKPTVEPEAPAAE